MTYMLFLIFAFLQRSYGDHQRSSLIQTVLNDIFYAVYRNY